MSLTKTTVSRRVANPRSLAWLLCLTLIAATCAAGSALPSLESSPILRVALFAAMGFAMLGTVFLFPETTDRNARRLILLAAVLLPGAMPQAVRAERTAAPATASPDEPPMPRPSERPAVSPLT